MILNGVEIDDTFAEAFPMVGTRLDHHRRHAEMGADRGRTMTGFATSVIACGCEAGIERELLGRGDAGRPAGRLGADLRAWTPNSLKAARAEPRRPMRADQPDLGLLRRARGRQAESRLGKALRYFGDGWQISKNVDGRRIWRMPVMEGEFVCDHETRHGHGGVGGGNLLILARPRGARRWRRRKPRSRRCAKIARLHHAVSGRHRALGLQGRLEIQGHDRLHQRRLLPDAAGRRDRRRCRPRSARCWRS